MRLRGAVKHYVPRETHRLAQAYKLAKPHTISGEGPPWYRPYSRR
jgi:hypothetical protein